MKNKIIVAIIALVALLGLFLIIKSVSAKTIEPEECCKAEEEIAEVYPETTTSSRRTGGYIKQIKPTMVYNVVKYGDIGQAVKDFQMFLNNKGAKLVVDGIFGPLTNIAWLEFEKTIK